MPEYLETMVDKFLFRVAKDRLYSAEGIWVLPAEGPGDRLVRIGLSDFLQQRSGDVAFIHPQAAGARLAAGDALAELETIKADLDLSCPVAGEIVEINAALETTPEIINQDPYGKGWVAIIQAANWEADRQKLLDPQGYLAQMERQAKEERSG